MISNNELKKASEFATAVLFQKTQLSPPEVGTTAQYSELCKAWASSPDAFRSYAQQHAYALLDPYVSHEHLSDYKMGSPQHEASVFGHLKWTRYLPAQMVYDRLKTLPLEYGIACAIEHLGPAVDMSCPKTEDNDVVYRLWQLWHGLKKSSKKYSPTFDANEKTIIMQCLKNHKDLGIALDLPDLNNTQLEILRALDQETNSIWMNHKTMLEATGIEYMDIDLIQAALQSDPHGIDHYSTEETPSCPK